MNNLRAFILGVRDGWNQPHDLSTSYNVDHLHRDGNNVYEWQDRGINIGQIIRAGRQSQAWALRYWPRRPSVKS